MFAGEAHTIQHVALVQCAFVRVACQHVAAISERRNAGAAAPRFCEVGGLQRDGWSDLNAIKLSISTFNRDYFPATPVEITNSFRDPQHQVVLLSPFESKEKAMEYFALFSSGNEQLAGINDQGYPAFAIGAENYAQLFRSKDVDGYTTFFSEKYLDHQ